MPNGQDRYADKARKRSPRKGQPIHIGKLGAASVEGAVTDVARELLPLMSSVSEGTWKRLGKWAVALARTEGITPDNDVPPQLEQAIYADILFKGGIVPNRSDSDWKPGKFIARPLDKHDKRERKAASTTTSATPSVSKRSSETSCSKGATQKKPPSGKSGLKSSTRPLFNNSG